MVSNDLVKTLNPFISQGIIKTFRTKKEAIAAGSAFGWGCAIKIERRFENVWCVAEKDFQPSYIFGIKHDDYRFPLLRMDINENGVKFCPVLKIQVVT